MYRQHFGLTHTPLGKTTTELWDDGALAPLQQRFDWLLQSPGIGLLTGAPGVGKTAALQALSKGSINALLPGSSSILRSSGDRPSARRRDIDLNPNLPSRGIVCRRR